MTTLAKQIISLLVIVVLALSWYAFGKHIESALTKGESATNTPSENIANTGDVTGEVATLAPSDAPKTETGAVTPSRGGVLLGKLAPEFVRPSGFTNTEPFMLRDLRGKKIVVVEFLTSTSVESLRTLPYLSDWYAKYHIYGLSVVAIHTPRFAFERSKTLVDQFARTHGMDGFSVIMDNNAETWAAYKNTTWPHLYVIDLDGKIAYDHSGEGAYQEAEKKILELLNARAVKLKLPAPVDQKLTALSSADTAAKTPHSNELFFGAGRNGNLANGIALKEGIQTFDSLSEPKSGMLYLFGGWNISRESAASMSEHTSIISRFKAKQVFAIMGAQKILRVRVLLDGKALDQTNAGANIRFEKENSVFYVDREQLYDIVNLSAGSGEHTIELIPESGGLYAYTLTFN